ncbi:DNA-binding transcriptional regulator, XRE-family HTH domain [Oscillibacter sp. PC13]|nr:DNA-binding transcriptional regulator, XRE-family HTH domain [Oscillibacter sp. PC13]
MDAEFDRMELSNQEEMTFGEKLQGLRQKAGLSQDTLAEQLEVSRQAVSRWERDETMPEPEKIVALADLFAVTTDYLLRRTEQWETPQQPSRERRSGRDIMDRLGYLAKTRGYLLGWILVVWGILDLVVLLLMCLGMTGVVSAFW